MSPLAKVFVVLNLLLSLLFFGTSATLFLTRQKLKQETVELKKEYKDNLNALKGKVERQGAGLTAAHQSVQKLRGENSDVSKRLAEKTEEVGAQTTRAVTAESSRDKSAALATAITQEKTALQGRISKMQDTLASANNERDSALTQSREANEDRNRIRRDLEASTKELHETRIALATLEDKYEELDLQYIALKNVVGDIPVPPVPAPPLDAKIVAVDGKLKAVVLNVGTDQEVKEGHEFTIHRAGQFIGKVRVTKLYREMSGAKVLFEKEGSKIQENDSATTRVNSLNS